MPDLFDLTTSTASEQFVLGYTNTDGDRVMIEKTFDGCAQLNDVAELFQRVLLAAGFTYVVDVVIETSAETVWSASGLQGESLNEEDEAEAESE